MITLATYTKPPAALQRLLTTLSGLPTFKLLHASYMYGPVKCMMVDISNQVDTDSASLSTSRD